MRSSPLQNRVRPDGAIVATRQRGMYLGNRGGRIHDPQTQTLPNRRRHWATKQWICCVLSFKNRQRAVMGPGYTELFFMDEITALAAGHRPCFECRRADAVSFSEAWGDGLKVRARAPQMDAILHAERLIGRNKRMDTEVWNNLPIGAMIQQNDLLIAKSARGALAWSFDGYLPLARAQVPSAADKVQCLTPPTIRRVLAAGFQPQWHPSAFEG